MSQWWASCLCTQSLQRPIIHGISHEGAGRLGGSRGRRKPGGSVRLMEVLLGSLRDALGRGLSSERRRGSESGQVLTQRLLALGEF